MTYNEQLGFLLMGFCAAVFGWYLVSGFRSGIMETPGPGNLAPDRRGNPYLFWLCAVYNASFFLGSVWLMIEIARGNVG